MKQIWIPKPGPPSVLEVREASDPLPKDGEVRIVVEAAGVNFADCLCRLGTYRDAPPLPLVPGYEVAGTIDSVGEGVDMNRIGEPVSAAVRFGGYSSMVCVPTAHAIRRLDGMDASIGAAIPVTGLTAWMMLEKMGRVREGDRVLVHSAGGGVGLMALDIIRFRGAIAVGTASKHKHAFLKEQGYDQLIDYRNDDFEEALAGADGFDIILDPIGGDTWLKNIRLLKSGGRLICFGFSRLMAAGPNPIHLVTNLARVPWLKFNPIAMMNQNKGVMGVNMLHLWGEADLMASGLEFLFQRWEEGYVRPRIHAIIPFDESSEAHRILHDRENIGKVVLAP